MMSYLSKIVIIVVLGLIFYALGSALYYLVHDAPASPRVVKALTFRILLSIILFLALLLAYALGWITPNSVS